MVLAEFLLRYNARFGVPPVQAGFAYRTLEPGLNVASTLCIKNRRTVAKDNTVFYQQSTLQLFPTSDRPTYAGTVVEIQESSCVVYRDAGVRYATRCSGMTWIGGPGLRRRTRRSSRMR